MIVRYTTEIVMTRGELAQSLSTDLNKHIDENTSIEELTKLTEETLKELGAENNLKFSNVEIITD